MRFSDVSVGAAGGCEVGNFPICRYTAQRCGPFDFICGCVKWWHLEKRTFFYILTRDVLDLRSRLQKHIRFTAPA